MCKIILFPSKESAAYQNLAALFELCDNIENCNFYLESVETLFASGKISVKEMYTLRRIGRQKRIKLAHPVVKEPKKAETPGTYCYTPEMGEQKPEECQIEAQLSYYGSHYHLKTMLELKGRGITKASGDYGDKLNRYTVTKLAYEKLQKIYAISYKCALD